MIRTARLAGRAIKRGLLAYAAMTLAMLAWTFLWPEPDLDNVAPADAIVCLGGGMARDGQLSDAVTTRIDRCVELFLAGKAPVVVFTDGAEARNGTRAGDQMARYAITRGLPQTEALAENEAQSTLQNALFTAPLIPGAERVILVSEAFHLPRAHASFTWAAWEAGRDAPELQLVMSERLRAGPGGGLHWRMLLRESLAIWFNAGRALAYSAAPNPSVNWLH